MCLASTLRRTCKSSTVCSEFEAPTIIYAWALNASGFQLPDGVGQKVGPGNNIKYVVVQIHYGEPESEDGIFFSRAAIFCFLVVLFVFPGYKISPGFYFFRFSY